MDKESILIFLSRPNPFLTAQQKFIDELKNMLMPYNFILTTLQADNYDLSDSLKLLKGMFKQCYGVIIIGFKQIFIDKGKKKRDGERNEEFFNPKEIDISGQALTSPFCQIEGTMALLNDPC